MAVTKDEVAGAVAELEADGINVSTKSVRNHLGSGSFTTIQTFLAELDEERHALIPAPENVRSALLDTADLVWTRAVEQASRAHDAALRANKRETFGWLKFTLEGVGARTHGYAFTATYFGGDRI